MSLATRTASSGPSTGDDRDERSERLLGVDPHLRRHAPDYVGGKHGPSAAPPLSASAPFATASSYEPADALERLLVDQRADRRAGLARVADGQRARPLRELLGERVRDRAVGDDPLGRHADLALMEERAEARRRGGAVEVGVAEHDHRRLAAELEQHALELPAGLLGDDPSDPGRAGEVDPPRGRMRDQFVDHLGRVFRVRW